MLLAQVSRISRSSLKTKIPHSYVRNQEKSDERQAEAFVEKGSRDTETVEMLVLAFPLSNATPSHNHQHDLACQSGSIKWEDVWKGVSSMSTQGGLDECCSSFVLLFRKPLLRSLSIQTMKCDSPNFQPPSRSLKLSRSLEHLLISIVVISVLLYLIPPTRL